MYRIVSLHFLYYELYNASHENGNWEAGILRSHDSPQYCDSLFSAFYPQVIDHGEFWEYEDPNSASEDKGNLGHLLFHAELDHESIIIQPIRGFPEKVDYLELICHLSTGQEYLIEEREMSSRSKFFIFNLDADKILGNPCSVEISIKSDKSYWGKSWLIQNAVLSRNKRVRNLLSSINKFKADIMEGWNELDSVITFLSENLVSFSEARERMKTPSSIAHMKRQKQSKGIKISSITISDDHSTDLHELSSLYNNTNEIFKAVERVIENGISLQEHEDLEVVTNDLHGGKVSLRKSQERKTDWDDRKEKLLHQEYRDKYKLYRNIDIKLIYSHSLSPSLNSIRNEILTQGFTSEMLRKFCRLFVSITFLLKFTRFIRIEIPYSYEYSDITDRIKPPTGELKDIIKTFSELLHLIVCNESVSLENLREALIDSELLGELVLFLIEVWMYNLKSFEISIYQNRLYHDLVTVFTSKETIIQYVKEQLHNSIRFTQERENMLIPVGMLNVSIDLYFYRYSFERELGPVFNRHVKYSYYQRASNGFQQALDLLRRRPESDQKMIEEICKKKLHADSMIKFLGDSGPSDLGKNYHEYLHDSSRCIGIDELRVSNKSVICPNCSKIHPISIMGKLYGYEPQLCDGCSKLFLPIKNDNRKFDINHLHPGDWKDA